MHHNASCRRTFFLSYTTILREFIYERTHECPKVQIFVSYDQQQTTIQKSMGQGLL